MARFAELRAKKPHEIRDLYPTERNTAVSLMAAVQRQFADRMSFNYHDRVKFDMMAHDLFEKHMRLDVSINWDVELGTDGVSSVYLPSVVINGRLDALDELDHDRMKFEIRKGQADGVAGVMDPNTKQLKDEPKKRDIF